MKTRGGYLPQGYLGPYGVSLDAKYNDKLQKANVVVNEYNAKINGFDTQEENDVFAEDCRKRIDQIFKDKKENAMSDIKIGDKVTVKFSFEVDGIRKNNHKDGELTLTGWIMEGEKCVELVTIPLSCVVEQ